MNDTTRILYVISAWQPACPVEMIYEGMKAKTAIQAAAVIRTLEALENTELVTLTREGQQITWAALTDLGKERLQEAEKEMLRK